MDKETLWLVEWTVRPTLIATDLDKAVEFAKSKGYDVLSEEENIIVMRHKDRGWTNMTIRKVQINKEIPL